MAQSYFPTWLTGIDFPADGVGDLRDLQHTIEVGEGGMWVSTLKPGWMYFNGSEGYQYGVAGRSTFTVTTSGRSVLTGPSTYNPSWGPVLVYTNNPTGGVYVQHHNCFLPAQYCSWTSTGSSVWTTTIAVTGVVVGVRNLTQVPMTEVSSSGFLLNENYYIYDRGARTVSVRSAADPSGTVFVDQLVSNPVLRYCEVVIAESGTVSLSYKYADNVTLSRGRDQQTIAGTSTGDIVFTVDANDGDWIRADYYIPYSYCLYDHRTIHLYTDGVSGDSLTVTYETSLPTVLPAVTLTTPPITGVLNFNPCLPNAYRSGYLFYAEPGSGYSDMWRPATLKLTADKDHYCPSWDEIVGVSILVTDKNGLPIPYYPYTLILSTGASAISELPGSGMVDAKGEARLRISGSGSVVVSVVVSGLQASATITGYTPQQYISSTNFLHGIVNVVVTETLDPENRYVSYANSQYLDAIPRGTGSANPIKVRSLLNSEFQAQESGDLKVYTKQIPLVTTQSAGNLPAVSKAFGYKPQKQDTLIGTYRTVGYSTRIHTRDDQ